MSSTPKVTANYELDLETARELLRIRKDRHASRLKDVRDDEVEISRLARIVNELESIQNQQLRVLPGVFYGERVTVAATAESEAANYRKAKEAAEKELEVRRVREYRAAKNAILSFLIHDRDGVKTERLLASIQAGRSTLYRNLQELLERGLIYESQEGWRIVPPRVAEVTEHLTQQNLLPTDQNS